MQTMSLCRGDQKRYIAGDIKAAEHGRKNLLAPAARRAAAPTISG
jgi:hypothetical protein